MKIRNILSIMRLQFFVFAIVFLLSSCSKQGIEVITNQEVASLVVSVNGINPAEDKIKLQAYSNQGNLVGLSPKDYIRKESTKRGRLTMDVISNQDVLALDVDQSLSANGLIKQAGTNAIDGNVKYIFVLQRVSDGVFTHVEHYSTSEPRTNINNLQTDQEYKWYAYSYLTSDNITKPTGVSTTTLSTTNIPTFHDKTIVHASGKFKAVSGQNKIAIVFDHKLTQINIEVNVKKAYADITHIKGEIINRETVVKTGTFDFISGTTSDHVPASIDVEDLVFTNKTPGDNSVKVAKHYTSDPSLTQYSVLIRELTVQYPDNTEEVLNSRLPNGGLLEFKNFLSNNSGHILLGKLNLTFVFPQMRIAVFSNDNVNNSYRLGPNTHGGKFVRNLSIFGPNSNYVAIEGLSVDLPTKDNEATTNSTGWNRFIAMMNNPANYPEILIVANYHDYLNPACHAVLNKYLEAGGCVIYTHDDASLESATNLGPGMSLILGQTVLAERNPREYGGVYRFTDTNAGADDDDVLNGPFGDVRPYHWGQDRYGTTYITGYTGNDLIVYSTNAQNFAPRSRPGMAFFRHKTKKFFFIGDGGFHINGGSNSNYVDKDSYPFRLDSSTGLPVLSNFGTASPANSPSGKKSHSSWVIANSMLFGNMLSWLIEQAYFHPVDKTGPIVNP